jgi:hypothetical protein
MIKISFSVNLLNVGLHSYGFTANIANSILIFSSIEFMFLMLIYTKISVNQKKGNI